MIVKLLVDSAIQSEVMKLMKREGEAAIAVAYWGNGGAERTGVLARTRKGTRILCDLFSGCCNPEEMRKLINHAEVRTISGLHAKIWCTTDKVVIGSANASANGLGYEGDDTKGNIEACTLVEDRKFAQDAWEWFERIWNNRSCHPVDDDLIDEAVPFWRAKRIQPYGPSSMTLAEALSRPDRVARFQHVRIIAYEWGGPTKKQQLAADIAGSKLYSRQQREMWPDDYPFYFDETGWTVTPGEIYLDFNVSKKGGKFGFSGIYQVRE